MFWGDATPGEASAIGALGAIVSAAIKRTFNRETFSSALFVTLRLSAMVIWIVFAASVFTALYAVTGASALIGGLITGAGDPWMVIITMQFILFILGMFFDPTGIVLLTAPIRSEEHTSELQSLMRISYAVFCLKKKTPPT